MSLIDATIALNNKPIFGFNDKNEVVGSCFYLALIKPSKYFTIVRIVFMGIYPLNICTTY
jgi:hypothetical protein